MSILVTGARGQLGRELCRQLGSAASGLDVDRLDLTQAPIVHRHLEQTRPEAVINCAAYTQVDQAEREPEACRAVNVEAVATLADGCRRLGCPLVQISTDYVFGGGRGQRHEPYCENDPPAPLGVYAQSKADGEQVAATVAEHLIVRSCGLYAHPADTAARNFPATMFRLAAEGRPLRVVCDQRCTPSYVPEVAAAIIFLLGAARRGEGPWGIYHATNRGETNWYEFARQLFLLDDLSVELTPIGTTDYGAPAPRPAYSVLDTSKYHKLGGPPMSHWRESLANYVTAWRGIHRAADHAHGG